MSDKIHPPTPRRRQQAKEQGRGPRSKDLASALTLLSFAGLFQWQGPRLAEALVRSIEQAFQEEMHLTIEPTDALQLLGRAAFSAGLVTAPLIISIAMSVIAFHLVQGSWKPRFDRLAVSVDRVSVTKRLSNLFSNRSLFQFVFVLLKLTAVAGVCWALSDSYVPDLIALTAMSPARIAESVFHLLIRCCFSLGGVLVVLAAADYAVAWWQFERDLMMTEQELREEIRDAQRPNVAQAGARSQPVQAVH